MKIALSCALVVALTGCGPTPSASPPSSSPKAAASPGLARGVATIRSLPFDADGRATLTQVVGDARVVLLGESSHGAGNAFVWRAAMVRELHALGFRQLVMESGFYDCRRAYVDASAHRDAVRMARECAFDIWAEALEADPLWQAVAQGIDRDRGLRLWGMDPQLSGDVSHLLEDDLVALAESLELRLDVPLMRQTLAALRDDRIQRSKEVRDAGRQLLAELDAALDAKSAPWTPPTESLEFWRLVVDGLVATEEDYWLYQIQDRTIDSTQHNLRERQMARNLLFLLKQHPSERFIVWLHNAHAAKHLRALGVVDHGDHRHDFRTSVTLGSLLAEALEPDPLFIAMLSTEGSWSTANRSARGVVPNQPRGGLGDRLAELGIDRAFVDLRVAPRDWPWLSQPLSAPILGMEPSTAMWPDHVDVLFFEREMTPASTRTDARGRASPPSQ